MAYRIIGAMSSTEVVTIATDGCALIAGNQTVCNSFTCLGMGN